MGTISPEEVLALEAPTKKFMCPLNANIYGIDFLSFSIKDYDSKRVIFHVSKDQPSSGVSQAAPPANIALSDINEETYRKIQYNFSADVLKTPTISTQLTFSVGNNEVEDFRMIERHYFRNTLIKSYDFSFGFCIPCSTNTWEAVYAVPLLDDDLVEQMVANPYETRSDSFYFVNGELVMHNKADYRYYLEDEEDENAETKANGMSNSTKAAAKATAKATPKPGMKYAAKMSASSGSDGVGGRALAQAKAGAKSTF